VDCHQRLNEYLNKELIAFRYLYQCFNKKRSIFSLLDKKIGKSWYLSRVVQKRPK
jgi:hypothetical protein